MTQLMGSATSPPVSSLPVSSLSTSSPSPSKKPKVEAKSETASPQLQPVVSISNRCYLSAIMANAKLHKDIYFVFQFCWRCRTVGRARLPGVRGGGGGGLPCRLPGPAATPVRQRAAQRDEDRGVQHQFAERAALTPGPPPAPPPPAPAPPSSSWTTNKSFAASSLPLNLTSPCPSATVSCW